MKKLVDLLNALGENPRVLAFYVMTLVTTVYLALIAYKFFSNTGMAIAPEFVGMHYLLLTTYTGAVQGDRMNPPENGYQRLPGEFMAVSWVLLLILFTVLNGPFHIGDRAALADMWPMPITYIIGLLSVNYVFKRHPDVVQKVGQKLASIPTGKNGATPPATPAAS